MKSNFLATLATALAFLLPGDSASASGRDITFFVASDIHYGQGQWSDNEQAVKNAIALMNNLPGAAFSLPRFGNVATPRGVLVPGDLTDSGTASNWEKKSYPFSLRDGFVEDFPVGGGGGVHLHYPVYEGYGNHDVDNQTGDAVLNGIASRNASRATPVNTSANKYHYSWDWDDVHFINLNVYAGGAGDARDSLSFLQADLSTRVFNNNTPIVIMQHYGFDEFSTSGWWSQAERDAFQNAIAGYNVVAIFSGHQHYSQKILWNGIPNYVTPRLTGDNGTDGFYAVRMLDNEMLVAQRRLDGTWGNVWTLAFSVPGPVGIWTNTLGGSWPVADNWSNNIVASGSGASADFSSLRLPGAAAVSLDGARTVGNLVFGDAGNAHGWSLDAGGGGPLTLAGTNCAITVNNQTTTISAVLAGTNGLAMTGPGTLTLTALNTLRGTLTINGGTVAAELANTPDGTLPYLAGIIIANGGTLVSGNNALFGWNPNYVPITINAGGTMTTDNGMGVNMYGEITLAGGALASGNPHLTYGSYNFAGGASLIRATGTTLSTISAADFQFRAPTTVRVDSGSVLEVTGYFAPLAHSGAVTLIKTGTGTLILAGANTHGSTVVSNGILQVDGSLPASALTVTTNGTLTGNGTIGGATTVQMGATLAPGTNGIGALTVSNTLTLAGTTRMELSKLVSTLANDLVRCSGTVNFGGSLMLTNIGSSALVVSNKFTLFSGGARSGTFTNITWPALTAGLGWTNKLWLDGSIEVIQVVDTTPTNLAFSASSGGLTLTWPADHTGWRLLAQTNGLGLGLTTNWFPVSGSAATNQLTLTPNPNNPAVFFRLVYP